MNRQLNVGCGKVRLPGWMNVDIHGGDLRADIRSLPFRDDGFDVALASHVLEHVLDSRTAMWEMRRVLRSGGVFIVRVPYGIDGLFDPFHHRAFDLTTMDRFCHDDPNSLEYEQLFDIDEVRVSNYRVPRFVWRMTVSRWRDGVQRWLRRIGFRIRASDGKLINPFPLTPRSEITWVLRCAK